MSGYYKQINKITSVVLLAIMATTSASWAQGLGNAPYSALGLGELYGSSNVANMGMGELSVSNSSNFYLNSQNPALLARRQRFTIFEVGLLGQSKTLTQSVSGANLSQNSIGGNLNYIALAFPGSVRWNMAIQLRPYSYVDYQTRQFVSVPGSTEQAQYILSGKGALNKASYSSGVRLFKNIFVGAEAGFVFGNITNNSTAGILFSEVDPEVSQLSRTNYSQVLLRLGGAWRPKLSEKWVLNLGATHEFQTRMRAIRTDISQQVIGGQGVSDADTLQSNQTGSILLPQQTRLGFSLEQPNKLTVGVDVGFQPWSQFVPVDKRRSGLGDSYNVSVGAEFIPKSNSTKYWDVVSYRAGFQYVQTPYLIANQRVIDISGSVGVSLPIGSYLVNNLNLAVVAGRRTVPITGQLREQYIKVAVGVSLSDWWFRKPVLD
jgi:hypothetical protein